MGRCKSPGSLKSILWDAPQLPGASVPCSQVPGLPRAHLRERAAVWWLLEGRYSFLPECPPKLTIGGSCDQGWLWPPCWLIQREIVHFSLPKAEISASSRDWIPVPNHWWESLYRHSRWPSAESRHFCPPLPHEHPDFFFFNFWLFSLISQCNIDVLIICLLSTDVI